MNVLFSETIFCNKLNTTTDEISPVLKRGLSDISKFSISAFNGLNIKKKLPLVFTTQHGSWQQVFKIKERIFSEGEFSPSIFSKVSNNVAAGVISILNDNNLPYTTISAGTSSFEMGLLESFLQKSDEVIYIYAEENAPPPLKSSTIPGAFALHMTKSDKGGYFVEIHERIEISPKGVLDFENFLRRDDITLFETQHFTIRKKK